MKRRVNVVMNFVVGVMMICDVNVIEVVVMYGRNLCFKSVCFFDGNC